MSTLVDSGQLDKVKAEQLIAETPLMDGVEEVRVELGEDWTGDPAMWLIFRLRKDIEFDSRMVRKFNEYAAIIQTKILESDISRFPFKRLERVA
jgi:hypothetical protein